MLELAGSPGGRLAGTSCVLGSMSRMAATALRILAAPGGAPGGGPLPEDTWTT